MRFVFYDDTLFGVAYNAQRLIEYLEGNIYMKVVLIIFLVAIACLFVFEVVQVVRGIIKLRKQKNPQKNKNVNVTKKEEK